MKSKSLRHRPWSQARQLSRHPRHSEVLRIPALHWRVCRVCSAQIEDPFHPTRPGTEQFPGKTERHNQHIPRQPVRPKHVYALVFRVRRTRHSTAEPLRTERRHRLTYVRTNLQEVEEGEKELYGRNRSLRRPSTSLKIEHAALQRSNRTRAQAERRWHAGKASERR